MTFDHVWRWHDRVPLWQVCQCCYTTRRRAETIGEYLYRLDGANDWQSEEPACRISAASEMAASGAPTLFDLQPETEG